MVKLGKIAIEKVEADYCNYCDELVAKITLKQNSDNDYVCRECFDHTCKYCNEYVDNEGDFCCNDCIRGFKYDNRDKNE